MENNRYKMVSLDQAKTRDTSSDDDESLNLSSEEENDGQPAQFDDSQVGNRLLDAGFGRVTVNTVTIPAD